MSDQGPFCAAHDSLVQSQANRMDAMERHFTAQLESKLDAVESRLMGRIDAIMDLLQAEQKAAMEAGKARLAFRKELLETGEKVLLAALKPGSLVLLVLLATAALAAGYGLKMTYHDLVLEPTPPAIVAGE